MENTEKMAEIRKRALDDVDRAERRVRRMPILMAVVEGGLLIAYLCVMDFHARLHWLILIAAVLTYGTVTAGLAGMGTYINLNTQRILKAIALSEGRAHEPEHP